MHSWVLSCSWVVFLDRRLGVLLASLFMLLVTFFVTHLPPWMRFPAISATFIVLLALPAFITVIFADCRRGLVLVLLLGAFSVFIESIGVATGFPYGEFMYAYTIGAHIGVVPWTVFFAWSPLVIGVWAFARKVCYKYAFPLAVFSLVVVDLVLDPVNAALGFWVWPAGGFYYGVPLSNFAGWVFSGAIGVFIAWRLFPYGVPLTASYSVFLTLLFVTAAAFWLCLLVPLFIGLGLLVWLYLYMLPVRLRYPIFPSNVCFRKNRKNK